MLPWVRDLPMLGLGSSIGTPPEGIEAEAIVVKSFEELDQIPENEVKKQQTFQTKNIF